VFRILLTTLLSFDPNLSIPADAIPGQVPSALVLESQPVDGRLLRGDYEVPDRVLLVFTETWAVATEAIALHVLQSGAKLTIALESDNPRWKLTRLVRQLALHHEDAVEVLGTTVDTPWVRDWGPIQVTQGGDPLWLDSDYDDADRQQDNEAPTLLGRQFNIPVAELPWPLDGGAFVSNGAGLCVLTLEYLDEQGIVWDEEDLGQLLAELGCRVTALIPTLLEEDTKHADMIVQFVGPNRLMIAEIVDDHGADGENALRLRAAEHGILRAAATLGIKLEVIRVPTPPIADQANPRSYINGLRLGDRYLMPSYPELGGRWDLDAWAAVQKAMGDVPVVPIRTTNLIGSGGALHCAALGLFTR